MNRKHTITLAVFTLTLLTLLTPTTAVTFTPLTPAQQSAWDSLAKWAEARGITCTKDIVMANTKEHGITFKAIRDIKVDSDFCTVPKSAQISAHTIMSQDSVLVDIISGVPRNAHNNRKMYSVSDTDYTSLWLMMHSFNKSSEYRPWIEMMQQDNRLPFRDWTEEEMAILDATSPRDTYSQYSSRQAHVEMVYNMLVANNSYVQSHKELFPLLDKYTFEAFEWAFTVIESRSFNRVLGGDQDELVLVPIADLVFADMSRKRNTWSFGPDEGAFFHAAHDIKEGSEVVVDLGLYTNIELIGRYNVALANFEDDSFDLLLPGISKSLNMAKEKKRMLKSLGFPLDRVPFRFTRDKFSTKLVQFLRIMHLNQKEYELISKGPANAHKSVISKRNEKKVLNSILQLTEYHLGQYNENLTSDMKALKTELSYATRQILTARAELKKTLLLNKLNAKYRLSRDAYAKKYVLITKGMDQWNTPTEPETTSVPEEVPVQTETINKDEL